MTEIRAAGVVTTFRDAPPAAKFLLLGVFINQFGAFLSAFLVLYLAHRGFGHDRAGWALAVYGAGAVVGLLFGGGLTDRLGPRLTIIIGMVCSAVLTVAISLVGSYPVILAIALLAGATAQSYRPAASTMLAELFPPARQVMAFSMNRIALNLGTVAGPLVAAWLTTISWSLLFWADAATSLLYAAIAVFLLPKVAGSHEEDGDVVPGGYATLVRDKRFLLYLFAMLTNALVYIQATATLPLSITDRGFPTVVYASVFAVGAGLVVTCEFAVTRVTQHWRPWVAVCIGLTLLGTGTAGYGLPVVPLILLGAAVSASGQIIGGPQMFAWPARVAPAGARGRYIGAANSMFFAGQALGPILGVFAYQHAGDRVWLLFGGIALLSVLSSATGMRPRPARPSPPVVPQVAGDAVVEAAKS